jgi:hypothetical protein
LPTGQGGWGGKMKWVVDGLEGLSRNPFFGGVTAVLGVFAGALGSLYTAEIKGSFPFVWQPVALSHEAALFWLSLVVFLFMFFSTQWAQNRAANRAQKELVSAQRELIGKSDQLVTQTEQLERLIRTMPPEGFLAKFDELYKQSHAIAVLAFSEGATKDDVEEAIRVILDCIVSLAHFFDGYPPNVRYSANIMLFVACAELKTDEREALRQRLQFVPNDTDLSALRGVLDLQVALSTTTDTHDPVPDDQLVPFALPVHKAPAKVVNGNRRFRILPGAPEAFEFSKLAGFHDIAMLESWCREKGDFPPTTIEDILAYFRTGPGQSIKSFCSVPLARWDHEEPVGVLNIHRDAEDMLKQKGAVLFIPLTTPFRLLLVDLIRWRSEFQTP